MRQDDNGVRIRVDGYTRCCLTAIVALLGLLIVGLWADRGGFDPGAQAETKKRYQPKGGVFTDSAKQRNDLVKSMDKNTAKLEEIARLLQSGQVKVHVVKSDVAVGGQHGKNPGK